MNDQAPGRAFATHATRERDNVSMPLHRLRAAVCAVVLSAAAIDACAAAAGASTRPPALAVLGDSDSHGYQDTRAIAPGDGVRGGRFRPHTLQWTEALAALRPQALDLGERVETGSRGSVARIAGWFGRTLRAPRKLDHRYNFAVSGAGCEELLGGRTHQAASLAALIDAEPGRWHDGVVVIRMGINALGTVEALDAWAGGDPAAVRAMNVQTDMCTSAIADAVALLHRQEPGLRIVLIGLDNNADWVPNFERWQSPLALKRIHAGIDRYDEALKRLALGDKRLVFENERQWFAKLWGQRDAAGRPAYGTVRLADGYEVPNTQCDEPRCAILSDGHAGLVWNTLWAQMLVDLLNGRWMLGIPPITDAEVAALVHAQVEAGRAPAGTP